MIHAKCGRATKTVEDQSAASFIPSRCVAPVRGSRTRIAHAPFANWPSGPIVDAAVRRAARTRTLNSLRAARWSLGRDLA